MSDDITTEQTGKSGFSRRDLMKAGGVVAGAVWVAPVIDSFVTVAAAGSVVSTPAQCAGKTCTTFTNCYSADSDCVCASVYPSGGFCVSGSVPCASLAVCGAGNTCPPGSIALVNTCCGPCVCYAGPGCVASRGMRAQAVSSGATIGSLGNS